MRKVKKRERKKEKLPSIADDDYNNISSMTENSIFSTNLLMQVRNRQQTNKLKPVVASHQQSHDITKTTTRTKNI